MEVVRGSIPRSARCFLFRLPERVSVVPLHSVVVFSTTPWLFSVLYHTARAKAWAFGSKQCTVLQLLELRPWPKCIHTCIIHILVQGAGAVLANEQQVYQSGCVRAQ